jgi:hypothetical protein
MRVRHNAGQIFYCWNACSQRSWRSRGKKLDSVKISEHHADLSGELCERQMQTCCNSYLRARSTAMKMAEKLLQFLDRIATERQTSGTDVHKERVTEAVGSCDRRTITHKLEINADQRASFLSEIL